MLHDSALYKFMIDIDIDIDKILLKVAWSGAEFLNFKPLVKFETTRNFKFGTPIDLAKGQSQGQKVQKVATRQACGAVSLRCDAAQPQRDGAARPVLVMHSDVVLEANFYGLWPWP